MGNGNLKDIIYHIYGRDVASALIELEAETDNIKVYGFVGKPHISRGNRNYESYFINGRYIKSPLIYRAIEEAYKTFTMTHKYPFICLNMEIRPDLLDINVHPTKMEIRFENGNELYELLATKIREVLLTKDLIPQVQPDKEKKQEGQNRKEELKEMLTKSGSVSDVKLEKKKMPEPFERNRRREEQKGSSVYAGLNYDIKKKSFPFIEKEEEKPHQMTLNETSVLEEKAKPGRKVIGQLFRTYWLIEYEDELFIMDQHAAHEKVNYEKLMRDFKKKEIYSQGLEPPLVITVSMSEAEVLRNYADIFAGLGFTIEAFGGNEFCIRQVPANLYGIGEEDLFIELLDCVSRESPKANVDIITDKIATMACKMSIKGNQKISLPEVEHLLDQLMELENPYQCPHGRPTIIKMSKYEIEKKFKRIV